MPRDNDTLPLPPWLGFIISLAKDHTIYNVVQTLLTAPLPTSIGALEFHSAQHDNTRI